MAIWDGIHLMAYPRGSGKNSTGVVQGVCYSVERITDDAVTIKMLEEYCPKHAISNAEHEHANEPVDVSKAKAEVKVPIADLPIVMRLTHALCYYTVQGRTLRGHTALLDTENLKFSRRALIVGLSRAVHGSQVHICTERDAELFLGRKRRTVKANRVLTT